VTDAATYAITAQPIAKALTAGQNRPERLPGLLSVLGQLPKELTEEAKSVVYLQPKIRLIDVMTGTFADASAAPNGGVVGAVWAEKWRQRVYFLSDSTMSALFVEVAGGGETPPPPRPSGRPVSRTESNIIGVLYKRLARALTNAFSILVDVTFEVVAVAEKLEAEHLIRPASPVITARLSVEWLGEVGTIAVIIPLAAIDPIRATLAQAPASEAVSIAPEVQTDWSRQLSEEIARAFVGVEAVLEERPIALSEVSRFAVGQMINLECTSISTVRLDAEHRPVFWCELGKSGGSLLLRIERPYDADDEPYELI